MKRSSSSKNATRTYNNQRNVQLSTGDFEGQLVAAGGDVTVLDGGAIDGAFEFSGQALDVAESVVINAMNLVGKDRTALYEQQQDALLEISERSRTETAQSLSEFTKYFFGTVGVLGLAAALAYGTKK